MDARRAVRARTLKVAFDTNVLAYAEGVNDFAKRAVALQLVRSVAAADAVIPVQVLGELYNVLVRKAKWSRIDARDALLEWRNSFCIVETTSEVMSMAMELSADHNLSIWDAVVFSAAARGGCQLLLSEDLQNGFTWSGVTVVSPFASPAPAAMAFRKTDPP